MGASDVLQRLPTVLIVPCGDSLFVIPDRHHGLYRTRGSVCAFLLFFHIVRLTRVFPVPLSQVGPVLDKFKSGGIPYEGQYIAAGFSGHGMPRAFGWFV
jgi:hypothetical protein